MIQLPMKYKAVFLLIIFLAGGGLVAAAEEGPFRVVRVRFVGVKAVSKKDLTQTLTAKPLDRWRFWSKKPVLSEADLADDLHKIKQFYQAYGFFNVKAAYAVHKIKDIPVKVSKDTASDKTALDSPGPPSCTAEVVFEIEEGPPVLIQKIDIRIEGLTVDQLEGPLRAALPIAVDRPFEVEKYRESKTAIEKELGKRGYPFHRVSGNVTIDIRLNTAAVSFEITPGEKKAFGALTITQQGVWVEEIVIRRAVTVTPGEVFNAEKIEQGQRNLYDLDVFKSATITVEDPPTGEDAVPMRLELKPKKRQSVKFGVGYGSEDGVRLKSGWTYRNLGGWAGRLGVNAKRSDLYEGIWGDYTQPYFGGADNYLRSGVGFENEKLDSYENQKTYGNVTLTRKLDRHWETLFGYNLEANRLEDIRVTDPEELAAFEQDHNYWISSVTWGISQNTTDNDITPRGGHRVSFSVETATEMFGSNLSFVKPDFEVKLFRSAPFESVLAGRLRLQSLEPMENTSYIPIFNRLFLGGSNTVRGYGYQQLGPMDASGNPLGGLSAMNANLELRRGIHASFSGVLFLDMGSIAEKSFYYDISRCRYSSGVGIRYDTPIGPVRVDWGYKLTPSADEKKDLWRLHFSIGQAF